MFVKFICGDVYCMEIQKEKEQIQEVKGIEVIRLSLCRWKDNPWLLSVLAA